MICYRDRTYCSADCATIDCDRNTKSIGMDMDGKVRGLYVALSDLSATCGKYQQPTPREDSGQTEENI